ncbi:MAG: hypothetical protein CME06_15710 [Gemmatimonadetes bacterium]|nr:hypothetical protein [Gemmatimonadota bacterium]
MTGIQGLEPAELTLVRSILERHPAVTGALLFGSRAKGTAARASDIDLALEGVLDPLRASAVGAELEALPLPYRFDVVALAEIAHGPLLEHIERVGIRIYG